MCRHRRRSLENEQRMLWYDEYEQKISDRRPLLVFPYCCLMHIKKTNLNPVEISINFYSIAHTYYVHSGGGGGGHDRGGVSDQ